MHFTTIAAAALLAVAPVAAKAGTAILHNMCDFDVYLWSVSGDENPSQPHTLEAGGSYSETYKKPSFGGVSIKLSNSTSCSGPITQFEYTLDDHIWYDLSNVDCHETECPFQKHGMYMESGDGCPTVSCPAGNLTCSGAYTQPFDDQNSLCCAKSADTVVYLCATSADGSPSPASSSAASVPAPSSSQAASAAAPSSSAAAATTEAPASTSEAPVSVATTLATSRRVNGGTTANVVVTKTVTTRVWGHRHTARAAHHPHARH